MKSLFIACAMLIGLQANANYDIQKFPGRVDIRVDVDSSPSQGSPIDILFVVDNSGSMATHQQKIASLTPIFTNAIVNMHRDFHVGVISTDVEGTAWGAPTTKPGYLIGNPSFIDANNPDANNAIARNLVVGTNGSALESPFKSMALAFTEPNLSGYNKGFLRPDAALAIVLLTDAEDQSPESAADTVTFLKGLEKNSDVTAFSWIVPSNSPAAPGCDRDDSTVLPKKIEDLTTQLNGEIYSICDMNPTIFSNFADKLARFGTSGGGGGKLAPIEVPLTIAPDASTIKVTYGKHVFIGGDLKNGWVYDSSKNAVIMGSEINWNSEPQGTQLVVSFVPADWQK